MSEYLKAAGLAREYREWQNLAAELAGQLGCVPRWRLQRRVRLLARLDWALDCAAAVYAEMIDLHLTNGTGAWEDI